ncbi:MAG TPA: hypothetical protein VN452_08300 [Longilinea sp.]|nr:hypothetical protein [Longilinea sp.]
MSKKLISQVLMAAGVVLVIVSLAADLLGIGSYPGIHSAQIAGAAIGLLAVIIGYWLSRAKVDGKSSL